MGREHSSLAQQLVDQRGLSVVDVSDDGKVADGPVHGAGDAGEKLVILARRTPGARDSVSRDS
jgi:hypothetical protein